MRHERARRGQTAVMFTLMMIPLFGVVGLVVDIGWAYYRREAAQTAADAAASAAAEAAYAAAGGGAPLCSTPGVACYSDGYTCPTTISSATNNILAGCMYAADNGFTSTGKQRVVIQSGVGTAPTSSGVTVAYWVVVRVTEQIPQLFSSVLGYPNAVVAARTTTGTRVATSGGCVIALNPAAAGSISMNGNTNLTSGCGVFDNSSSADAINIVGGGTILTTGSAKTQIAGGWQGSGTISPAPQTNQPHMGDPFADMDPPTYSGCTNNGVSGGSHDHLSLAGGSTITVICGDLSLGAQSTLTLGAGLYVVTGSISMGGQTSMSGSGVTFYLPNGGVSMAGGATVSLSAPSTGDWQGILFYQKRGNATGSTLVGGTNQQMNGVLYFPSANLTYTGGSGVVATATTLVCDTLTLVGNSYINASATTAYTGNTGGVSLIE
jgi:Putative Flp pilus-assembly TadE/G-like